MPPSKGAHGFGGGGGGPGGEGGGGFRTLFFACIFLIQKKSTNESCGIQKGPILSGIQCQSVYLEHLGSVFRHDVGKGVEGLSLSGAPRLAFGSPWADNGLL